MQEQSTSLYSKHAGSNKEYHVYLKQSGDGWVTNYAYGAVGQALKPGTKTAVPVSHEKAMKAYEKLIKEKKNGDSHYTEGEAGTVYENAADPGSLFGLFPQEPTPITRDQLDALLRDDAWGMQEKANGRNRLLGVFDSEVRGGNKLGKTVAIPQEWVMQFRAFGNFIANGEHVADRFLAFDLLEYDGKDLRGLPQMQRYEMLVAMQRGMSNVAPAFGILECHYTEKSKRALLEHIELTRLEGVVAKNVNSPYREGRGRDSLKFRFFETITCIVIGINQKNSVQIGLFDREKQLISVGNVTIPEGRPVPKVNDLVDVQFLYFNPGGALEIPVYDPDKISPRDDVDREACTLAQITRFKPEAKDVDPDAYKRRLAA